MDKRQHNMTNSLQAVPRFARRRRRVMHFRSSQPGSKPHHRMVSTELGVYRHGGDNSVHGSFVVHWLLC
ncbi:hypothetical protein ANCCAN_24547 [Ancylostoma caninum]|uniref:Uncharacterized protein n=1 Tax=Ancylostoma caninum TaxID=29170 RepID=A0A368FBZ2_ANCCA|nr:hypothetical protein ANCCAN_24547 [Ancylostoma caninum]